MTSKEIREIPISAKDIVHVHELHLVFLQEIAAQLAEFNEGRLLTQPVDLELANEPEEGTILTGPEAVQAAQLETEIHETREALKVSPIFTPDRIQPPVAPAQKSPFSFPPPVGSSGDGLIRSVDDTD